MKKQAKPPARLLGYSFVWECSCGVIHHSNNAYFFTSGGCHIRHGEDSRCYCPESEHRVSLHCNACGFDSDFLMEASS
jgi:hypothetical protein